MPVDASIDIELRKNTISYISPIRVIEALLNFGWTLNDYGKVTYLPLGDVNNFDWQSEEINQNILMNIVKEKEQKGELIGLVMTWQDTNIGGLFLLRNNNAISICLTINRKCINENLNITDVNWYLTRLLPALNNEKLLVEYFTYGEHR